MLFFDIDNPSPDEIKVWMKKNDFTIDSGSFALVSPDKNLAN